MAEARWDNEGNAANIEAAADDAILWLNLLMQGADRLNMPPADRESLHECRNALTRFCGARSADAGKTIRPLYSHDEKALATAQEIALMWGQSRSQFVSRIQVAVLDAMRWASPAAQRQIEDCPELNLSNYDAYDVERLNDWAVRADAEIERITAGVALPAPMHPDCTAPDCDCEPGIECAARGAALGVLVVDGETFSPADADGAAESPAGEGSRG